MSKSEKGYLIMTGVGFVMAVMGGSILWGPGGAFLAGGFAIILISIPEGPS